MSTTPDQPPPTWKPDRNHMVALAHALELLKQKQFAKAEGIGLRVAEADPYNPDAFFIASVATYELNNPLLALERVNIALQLQPETAEFHNHRGVIQNALDQPEEAMTSFLRALKLNPNDPSVHANLARILLQVGQAHQALQPIRQAISLKPDDPTLLGDMAVILVACKQLPLALSLYEQALHLAPNDPEIHFNYSRALLLIGRYLEGWQENEWRWHSNHYQTLDKQLPAPCWDGSLLTGKRITIITEQGFGDALQFVRYAQLLQQQGATVFVQCRPELVRLFQVAQGVDQAISLYDPLPTMDLCIPMLSLPLLFQTRNDTIPSTPYLTVPQDISLPLPIDSLYFRVGLVWSGNNQRHFNFLALEPLLAVPGVEFHSIQPGPQAQKAQERGLPEWSAYLQDFANTAALMSQLDLIITIDTASAHLAGGLGRPFWLLTHATADWRWGLSGPTTPWYPTARLFRQTQTGQWGEVIEQMTVALQQLLSQR